MTESPDSPWLSDDEQRAWRAYLISSRAIATLLDRQLQRDAGIPHSWFGMLTVLSSRPGRTLRQTDLAAMADFSPSRMSHACKRMAERGWIQRTEDPHDARVTNLRLTDAGFEALDAMARGHAQAVRELFVAPLDGAQLEALETSCAKLIESAAAAGGVPAWIDAG